MKKAILIVGALSLLLWLGFRIVAEIKIGMYCEDYLKRAADANTVAIAKQELARAIDYAERQGLTSGYTSILYRTPDEDVGFWFSNLKASLAELEAISEDATQLERTNVLMKLRETLLDKRTSGESVTAPAGIALYPYNAVFALWGIISLIVVGVDAILYALHVL